MNSKSAEYIKACRRGTRRAGVRLLRGRAVKNEDGRCVTKLTIGYHSSQEDAEGFLEIIKVMLNSQRGRATDYFQWGFALAGDDDYGNSYFKVVPLDYYEKNRSFNGNPLPYFQLPSPLGFVHESGSVFRYSGDELCGRAILVRVGLKELDCE